MENFTLKDLVALQNNMRNFAFSLTLIVMMPRTYCKTHIKSVGQSGQIYQQCKFQRLGANDYENIFYQQLS